MSIDKSIFLEYQRLQKLVECALLYKNGLPKKDIAKKLKVSPSTVTRYIDEVIEKGILLLDVKPKPFDVASIELKSKYRLREAYVYPIGATEEIASKTRDLLAFFAANYLEELLGNAREKILSVTIGPGETSLKFVTALSDEERRELTVLSSCSASILEIYLASNVLIGVPAAKWKCNLSRYKPGISKKDLEDYSDILFFGIGRIPDINGVTAKAILYESRDKDIDKKIDEKQLSIKMNELFAGDAISLVNYQPIKRDGQSMEWDWDIYKEIFYEKQKDSNDFLSGLLSLDSIKGMAMDPKKRVVCVSGGDDRAESIDAALKGGYFNVLITDYGTSKRLLGWDYE